MICDGKSKQPHFNLKIMHKVHNFLSLHLSLLIILYSSAIKLYNKVIGLASALTRLISIASNHMSTAPERKEQ